MANRGRHRKKITPEKAFKSANINSQIIIKRNLRESITYLKCNFIDYEDFKYWLHIWLRMSGINQIIINNKTFNPSEIDD